jgi:hypothetical protein
MWSALAYEGKVQRRLETTKVLFVDRWCNITKETSKFALVALVMIIHQKESAGKKERGSTRPSR